MTLEKRIDLVRTLTIVQLVLSMLIAVVMIALVGTVGVAMMSEMSLQFPPMILLGFVGFFVLLVIAVSVVLPWIVLTALKKRQEQWATAAFVSLIVQIVLGGGVFSVFPIISLILLLNKDASAYIGMK